MHSLSLQIFLHDKLCLLVSFGFLVVSKFTAVRLKPSYSLRSLVAVLGSIPLSLSLSLSDCHTRVCFYERVSCRQGIERVGS